jgi:hypothetical protein
MLFQLQRLYDVEYNGDISMNEEQIISKKWGRGLFENTNPAFVCGD